MKIITLAKPDKSGKRYAITTDMGGVVKLFIHHHDALSYFETMRVERNQDTRRKR